MFLKFKFSILNAYQDALQIRYKHLFFYLSWYAVIWCISFLMLLGWGVYTDIFNFSVMIQNYNWIIASFKQQVISFFIGFNFKDVKITGFSFYDFLKLLFSEDILNNTLSTMSLKEYFNVVLFPLKMVLVPLFIISLSFIMTISIGYIKTALLFQDNKQATLYDMYQYMYLVPQYFLGKIIIFSSSMTFICIPILIGLFVVDSSSLFKNIQNGSFFEIVLYATIFLLVFVFFIFIYQRLRFIKYFIIDQEVSAFKACSLSWKLTRGSVVSLTLFSSVTLLVMIIHPMTGLFIMITGWLNQQAEVSVYRQMIASENK